MNSMVRVLLILVLLNISCTHTLSKKDEIFSEVDKFLDYAKQDNEKAIYRMSYHVNYRNHITDEDSRKTMANQFSRLINKYGIPSHEKWLLEQTSLDYQVHIPILNFDEPNMAVKNVELVISLTPPGIANKIYDFNVRNEIDTSKKVILQAPPLAK